MSAPRARHSNSNCKERQSVTGSPAEAVPRPAGSRQPLRGGRAPGSPGNGRQDPAALPGLQPRPSRSLSAVIRPAPFLRVLYIPQDFQIKSRGGHRKPTTKAEERDSHVKLVHSHLDKRRRWPAFLTRALTSIGLSKGYQPARSGELKSDARQVVSPRNFTPRTEPAAGSHPPPSRLGLLLLPAS